MFISEEEKKEILSKYQDDTSEKLLTYLKRNFPVGQVSIEWMEKPNKYIVIDDKTRFLDGNKKYLVNKLAAMLETEWVHLGEKVIRRTIKKFIDGISL